MSKVLKTTRAIAAYWLSAVVFISLTSSAVISAGQVPFITLDKGGSSGIRERKFVVVKTEQEWAELWRAHASVVIPPRERPSVDFNNEMVVAAFLGEQRNGGFTVEITRIEENSEKNKLNVFWRETKPLAGGMTSQALTQPYHVVKNKKLESTVTFVSEKGF
jgi:hypothetical protein